MIPKEMPILPAYALTDKVAIITGGSGSKAGLGRNIVMSFATAGATTVLCDLNCEKGIQIAEEISRSGGHSIFLETDVTKSENVRDLVKATIEKFGRIDILVNNAGGGCGIKSPLWDITENQWDSVINLNLKGTFLCCKYVSKVMIEQKSGCIINIASSAAERPMVDNAAYGAAKAAIVNLTQTMAVSLAPYNVRIHAISPGPEITSIAEGAAALRNPIMGGTQKPLPIDISLAALFLASGAAMNVTGLNITMRKLNDA